MRMLSIAGILAVITCVGTAAAQDTAQTSKLARTLSEVSGVPVGTALSDLVTKGSTTTITSTLQRSLDAASTHVPSLDPTLTRKGFVVREVELDSRFEANVNRVLNQVSLDALTSVSVSNKGVSIPPTSPSRNTISILGKKLSFPDIDMRLDKVRTEGVGPTPSSPTNAPGAAGSNLTITKPAAERSNERIWGGAAITDDADVFRDSVAILGGNKLCSGVLVADRWVVTAAHCFCGGVTEEVIFGTSILSTNRIKVDRTESKVFRTCEEIRSTPGAGDVALLRLESATTLQTKPIAPLSMIKDSAAIRAVGFGRTSTSTGFKYQVNIVIASYQCDGSAALGLPDEQVYRCVPQHELVAASLNKDTCGGDSGGGVYVFGPDARPYLAAVTSRGVHPSGECGRGGIYTLLTASPIREWIEAAGITVPQ